MSHDSNPFFLPEAAPRARGCPKCGHENWTGDMVMGALTFTCLSPTCKNKWQGGMAQGGDPRMPPVPPPAPRSGVIQDGTDPRTGGVREVPVKQSTVPDFRKGLPFPDPGDE